VEGDMLLIAGGPAPGPRGTPLKHPANPVVDLEGALAAVAAGMLDGQGGRSRPLASAFSSAI
jgi:hypothetical protein